MGGDTTHQRQRQRPSTARSSVLQRTYSPKKYQDGAASLGSQATAGAASSVEGSALWDASASGQASEYAGSVGRAAGRRRSAPSEASEWSTDGEHAAGQAPRPRVDRGLSEAWDPQEAAAAAALEPQSPTRQAGGSSWMQQGAHASAFSATFSGSSRKRHEAEGDHRGEQEEGLPQDRDGDLYHAQYQRTQQRPLQLQRRLSHEQAVLDGYGSGSPTSSVDSSAAAARSRSTSLPTSPRSAFSTDIKPRNLHHQGLNSSLGGPRLKRSPMFRVARALEDLLHVRLDAAIDDSVRDRRIQDQSLERIQLELDRTHQIIAEDVWKHLRKQFPEVASSLTARPYIEGTALSPLGLQAVVNERNLLRKQLRDAAEQIAHTVHMWKTELLRNQQPPFVSHTKQYLMEVRGLYQDIQTEFDDLQEEMQDLHQQLQKVMFEKRQAEHKHEMQVTELQHTIAMQDASIKSLKQAHAGVIADLQQLAAEKDELEASLRQECESIRQHGQDLLAKSLEQQREQILKEKQAELESALRDLRLELTSNRHQEADELRDHYEKRLIQLQESLTSRHAEELARELERALTHQKKELLRQAQLDKEQAVEAAIEMFRNSRVATLEEQRRRLEERHFEDKKRLQDKTQWQQEEISHLRASERSLILAGDEELPEHESDAWRLRQVQGLARESQSMTGTAGSLRLGRPKSSQATRPVSASRTVNRSSSRSSGVWMP